MTFDRSTQEPDMWGDQADLWLRRQQHRAAGAREYRKHTRQRSNAQAAKRRAEIKRLEQLRVEEATKPRILCGTCPHYAPGVQICGHRATTRGRKLRPDSQQPGWCPVR